MSVKNHLSCLSQTFKQSENYNRLLFEHSPIGVALCSMNGDLVDVNPAYANIIGRTVEETLQLSYWDITPPDYSKIELRQLQILNTQGHYGPYEKHYIHKSGHWVPVRLSGKTILLEGNSYIWSCVEDISDHELNTPALREVLRDLEQQLALRTAQLQEEASKKQYTEQAFRLEEAKYSAILNSAVDGIITIDENGVIHSFNPSAENIFGYTAAEVIGQGVAVLMPQPYDSIHDHYIQNYLTSGEAKIIGVGREVQGRRKDGSVFDMYLAVSDVAVEGRRLFTGIARDITELKQTQAELLKNEERLRRSQRFANIGTWDWNIQTGELYWSDRIAALFGYQEGELETTYENFLNAVHPDDRQFVIDAVNKCVQEGAEYHIEHRCLWPNGEVRWLLERGDVLRDNNGKPLRMLGVVQDISVRKQTEADLQAAKAEAERANRAKSEFLSNMSHELRTPLNAILGFAQLLEYDDELNTSQRESIAEIHRAGSHLLELINEVLDLSKIESGHVTLSPEVVSLSKIINECCALIQQLADKKNIKVRCDCCENEWGSVYSTRDASGKYLKGEVCIAQNCDDQILVFADSTRLKQVLLNLLSNAVKYNRDNGSVDLRLMKTADHMIRIEVTDTGCGIPEEQLNQLFKPFNRLGADDGHIEGTGIGLVITKRYVEMMSGNIGVESVPGAGSTFWIKLPLPQLHNNTVMDCGEDSSNTAMEAIFATNPASAEAISPGACHCEIPLQSQIPAAKHRHSLKLLVVEDNDTNQVILQQQLNLLGYQADIAANASQGFEMFIKNRYLGVLTDIKLPDINGYEFTKLIRQRDINSGAHTPIIAVTANALNGEAQKCLSVGMDDYLSKPVDLNTLGRILEKHMPTVQPQSTHTEPCRKNPAQTATVVDSNVLRTMLGDNFSAHEKVFRIFSKNSPQIVGAIHKAYASRSALDIVWHSHKLRSSSHAIGANQLAASCKALESAASNEDWQNVSRNYYELDRLFASVLDFISRYKDEKEGGAG